MFSLTSYANWQEPNSNMKNSLKVGLFVKTFKADLDWLFFGLSSFKRNWSYENSEILVVAEPDCEPAITKWGISQVRVVYVRPWPDGYTHAMAMKMCADIFMPAADLILLFDSDMVLTRLTAPADLLINELPTIYYDVWHSDLDPNTRMVSKKVWSPAVFKSTGRTLDVDWMVSPAWLYWRSTFSGARSLIENHTGMPFLQAVYSSHQYDYTDFMAHPMTFCDMQTLGIYANESERHLYSFRQRAPDLDLPITQFWSHLPVEEARAKLEKF